MSICPAIVHGLTLHTPHDTKKHGKKAGKACCIPQSLSALESIFDEAWNYKVVPYLLIGTEIFDSLKFRNYPQTLFF